MKFVPLGLIASILASVSARSLYSEGNIVARDAASVADVSGNNVQLQDTVSNILNGLLVAGNANGVHAVVAGTDTVGGGHIGGNKG